MNHQQRITRTTRRSMDLHGLDGLLELRAAVAFGRGRLAAAEDASEDDPNYWLDRILDASEDRAWHDAGWFGSEIAYVTRALDLRHTTEPA